MHQSIIASITKTEQLRLAMESKVKRVNLMTGNIRNLGQVVDQLKASDKSVYLHIEMVDGIGRDAAAVHYLAEQFGINGIISTKSHVIGAAKAAGIRSIQRFFAIDTAAVETAIRVVRASQPDEVELMPGLMPRVIQEVKSRIDQPLIVGGLIRGFDEVEQALQHGADFVSVGSEKFWS
ncbi:glycerol-3-phosphate responsive antiterminator [Paenibacillus cremeus]|uniref:Glycerol uptake operon antiterminator regulatory protein n=1 Tax=Paenibacillus cremeus TaxID=2163881 RepID=A0A559JPR9_9BACL|nr:glycerol-3-phosphate responsive antiterminator [Paenibacillus cremeus]TVY01860.1 glycerol-3-phosphate responsive antiterminator [Paenibacillus cremeus]